ncbi:MAG: DEAD/DEAH box helicase [Methanospirillum sp.]|nr:DEAD/DEAH box helicase [Methanospirillum sp.]
MPGVYDALHGTLQMTLLQRLGWDALRPLQEQTFRAATSGADLLVIAPTAGGKTEAAMIPVVDRALREGAQGVYCIYLSPLKALINDQLERVEAFCTPGRLSAAAFHGDIPVSERRQDPDDEPHVMLITPESLQVLLQTAAGRRRFSPLRFVVIDEVHAFAGTDRGVQVRALLDRLDRAAGRRVQRIGLSATVGNPADVLAWLSGPNRKRQLVVVPASPAARRFSFALEPDESRRADALVRLVRGRRALVFVASRSQVERLSTLLEGRVDALYCHHSSVSAAARHRAERASRAGEPFCIVCTSTLELGIDIGDLDLVVQLGPPDSVASFLQRLGRAGRRGQPARFAFVLARPAEVVLALGALEAAMRGEAEIIEPPAHPYHVLAQQLLLGLAVSRRTRRAVLVSETGSLGPFQAIPESELELVVDHLLDGGFIAADGDLLMVGPATETAFGGTHRRELYSVLRGGRDYRAVTPDGEEVGRLDARFARSDAPGVFSLGGRGWSVVGRDDVQNLLIVQPGSSATRRAFWSGRPGGVSPLVARSALSILAGRGSGIALDDSAQEALDACLARMPRGIQPEGVTVFERGDGGTPDVMVLTPFGAAGNRVVGSFLRSRLGTRESVMPLDLGILVRRAGAHGEAGRRVHAALLEMRSAPPGDVAATLPVEPQSSRAFGSLVPPALFSRMVVLDQLRLPKLLHDLSSGTIVHLGEDDGRAHDGSGGEDEAVSCPGDLRERWENPGRSGERENAHETDRRREEAGDG